MTYRPDIDGLRAVAVLAVVIFHLGVPGFDGGYVGVDVFFVISGFLITSLILSATEKGTFSLLGFYHRRLWRLIPALLVTIVATLLAATWIMMPYDLQSLGRSAAAAGVSLSNFVFWSEAGYWDSASELKPLLHTWSLGVEEQFYLVWPSLLLLAMAAGGRWLVTVLLALTALGGALLCLWMTGVDADAAFYLLPFRMFQFAIGALLIPLIPAARAALGTRSELASTGLLVTGLGLILFSVMRFDDNTVFPGTAVLLPTLGAAATIAAGGISTATSLHRVLSNPVMLWLGQASYAMYLVHWPIASLYRYETGVHLTVGESLALAAATLLATAALHHGVERQFYQRRTGASSQHQQSGRSLPLILGAMLVTVVMAAAFSSPYGATPRYQDLSLPREEIASLMQDRFARLKNTCRLARYPDHPRCRPESGINVLVFGNSHEPDAFNFLSAGYAEEDLNFFMFGTTNRCGEITLHEGRLQSDHNGCQQRLDALQGADLLKKIDWLVYAANRPFDQHPLRFSKTDELRVLQHLKAIKPEIKVMIWGGYINTDVDCSLLANQSRRDFDACKKRSRVDYFAGDDLPAASFESDFLALSDHYIDRVELLCSERSLSSCATTSPDGAPAFIDRHHASRPFAEWSGTLYAARHKALFNTQGTGDSVSQD